MGEEAEDLGVKQARGRGQPVSPVVIDEDSGGRGIGGEELGQGEEPDGGSSDAVDEHHVAGGCRG
ncbi:unnamed protein product [Clonostachys rhizophaga]|uniref:Uncharacterized protein n=1 Tax=Clonostachys rhizophaga TaxID=160324 RepID=A0A9N9W3X8_9HYPO|nr:unnamed protein product [Clonostachys rhizophaga]